MMCLLQLGLRFKDCRQIDQSQERIIIHGRMLNV